MTRRWQCSVCGYIHEGEEPPAQCPACGADRAQFVLLDEHKSARPPRGSGLLAAFKLHPVAAHFPNGLMPTAALFLLLSVLLNDSGFEAAAFWLVAVVTMSVPVVLGSGLYAWRTDFGGQRAPIFVRKICLAATLLVLGLAAITLRYGAPELLTTAGWQRWLFLACLAGMLGCVTLLGHYGGMLVFQQGAALSPVSASSGLQGGSDWAERIVARAPDAILAADASGSIRLWNHGAERIFGVPAGQAIGQSLDLIIPEKLRPRHWEGWGRAMRSGESRYGEAELLRVPALRGDGTRMSAEFSIVMLKDRSGKVEGVAAILRDVSEQRAREQQLQAQLDSCPGQQPPPAASA